MGSLAVGAAAAAILRMPQWRETLIERRKQLFWLCVGLLLVGAGISHGYLQTGHSTQLFGYSFLSAGFGIFVLLVAFADMRGTRGWPSVLRNPILCRFGLYSYGMYVLHVPLREALFAPLLQRWGLDFEADAKMTLLFLVVGTLITFAAAAASYHLFEVHFLRLKRFFVPSRAAPAPVEAAVTVAAPVGSPGHQ
jgi:peptidoglycan/LPS O-acetylase OafA/YrhL